MKKTFKSFKDVAMGAMAFAPAKTVMAIFTAVAMTSCLQPAGELSELLTSDSDLVPVSLSAAQWEWTRGVPSDGDVNGASGVTTGGIVATPWQTDSATVSLFPETRAESAATLGAETRAVTSGAFYLSAKGETEWAYTFSVEEAASAKVRRGEYDVYFVSGFSPSAADDEMCGDTDIITGKTSVDLTKSGGSATITAAHRTARVALKITGVPSNVEGLTADISGLYASVTPLAEYSGTASASDLFLENTSDGTWESEESYLMPSPSTITITLNVTFDDQTSTTLTSSCPFSLAANTPYTLTANYYRIETGAFSADVDDWSNVQDKDFDLDEGNGNGSGSGGSGGTGSGGATYSPGSFIEGTTILCLYHNEDLHCTIFADLTPYALTSLSNDHFQRTASELGTSLTFDYWYLPGGNVYPKKLIEVLQSLPDGTTHLSAIQGKAAAYTNSKLYYYNDTSITDIGTGNAAIIFGVIDD